MNWIYGVSIANADNGAGPFLTVPVDVIRRWFVTAADPPKDALAYICSPGISNVPNLGPGARNLPGRILIFPTLPVV